jgi:hypothetical protein
MWEQNLNFLSPSVILILIKAYQTIPYSGSVADPHHVRASCPYPTFPFDADLDLPFHFDADLDPASAK